MFVVVFLILLIIALRQVREIEIEEDVAETEKEILETFQAEEKDVVRSPKPGQKKE